MVPEGASVRVTGADDAVPRFQVTPVIVMASVTVQVSPGVAKVVGEEAPFVQLASVVIGPATLVVQAVALAFVPAKHKKATSNAI